MTEMKVISLDIPVLPLLSEENFISGEKLSSELSLSRVAVWKQIQKLKQLGYHISTDARKGYRIISRPDILFPYEIYQNLSTAYIGQVIYYFPQLESTNIIAKQKVLNREEKVPEGTIIIAEQQNAGKGRLGKKWFSPPGGIWLSLILYPKLTPSYMPIITLMTAIVVAKIISALIPTIKVQIKWPNDVLIDGKKVCGILTEMSVVAKNIGWVIVGIGINVNNNLSEFPEDIQRNSISLKAVTGKEIPRRKLVQHLCVEFENQYERYKKDGFLFILEEWKKYNDTIGRIIEVDVGNRVIAGEAIDINDKGALILKTEDGKSLEIISGTILRYY
ncbi:MAG: Biotin--(Acetyl-COA-carboxylase) synthetase [candidate division TA06 bacterium 34_109]|uniref:Bifunctional ligase/repressor BirA n=1 Tax=candidate division TA06 bacterium 34_109 TaxID=1635277 RepID=A0A101HZR3_UNCT6|nr:MAG: Biotin--(Acetyl-COA-carboxylase) synthetase [candidate division TA06 bacterium 34_109]